jgi:hypothetical protein
MIAHIQEMKKMNRRKTKNFHLSDIENKVREKKTNIFLDLSNKKRLIISFLFCTYLIKRKSAICT